MSNRRKIKSYRHADEMYGSGSVQAAAAAIAAAPMQCHACELEMLPVPVESLPPVPFELPAGVTAFECVGCGNVSWRSVDHS